MGSLGPLACGDLHQISVAASYVGVTRLSLLKKTTNKMFNQSANRRS